MTIKGCKRQISFFISFVFLAIPLAWAQDRPAPPAADAQTEAQFRSLINQGQSLTRERKFDEAAGLFRQALALRPQSSEAHVNIGMALLNQQRPQEALAEIKQALQLDPNNAAAHVGLGNVNQALRRFGEALENYQQAVKLKPDYANAWSNLGTLLGEQKRYAESAAAFKEVLRLQPNHANALNGLGIAEFRTGKQDEGIELVERAVEVAPNFANAWLNLGYWNMELGRYAEAVAPFTEVIRIAPKFPTAYRYRIYANFYLNNGALAAKDVRAWLALVNWDRDDALFLVLIGYFSYRHVGQAAEAQQLLELAAQRGDKAAWPYPLLRYLQGEITAAALLELANNNDRLTEVHGWLGKESLLAGKRAEALKHFRWVKENGNKQFIEYTFSLLELARLEKEAGKAQ